MDINRIFMELDHNKILSPEIFKNITNLNLDDSYLQPSQETAIQLYKSSYNKQFDTLLPTKTYKKQMEKLSLLERKDLLERQNLSYQKYTKEVEDLPRQYKLDFIKNKVWQLQ